METPSLDARVLEDCVSILVLHALIVAKVKPEELLPHKEGLSYAFKLNATARTVAENWTYVRDRALKHRIDEAVAGENAAPAREGSATW